MTLRERLAIRLGLWALGVADWAKRQLPPAPPPDIADEAEYSRRFLNGAAIMAEFATLSSHYGLVNATASKYEDGSYGLTEVFTLDRGPLAEGSVAAIGQYDVRWTPTLD